MDWRTFSRKEPVHRGQLLPEDALQRRIRALGLVKTRRVLVVGDPSGWGEDGRVVWMLRAVGHPKVALADGGFPALEAAGVPMGRDSVKVKPSQFSIVWDQTLSATADTVAAADGARVVDARTQAEFDGDTPYGESRGGHVPGATSLHFRDLLRPDGTIKSRSETAKLLAERGVTSGSEVLLYCTGGVRSGWLLVVLKHYGYKNVRNYAGSMWEWSAGPPAERPLAATKAR